MGDKNMLDFLDSDEAHWISHLAARKGVSEREILRRAIEEYARKEGRGASWPTSPVQYGLS